MQQAHDHLRLEKRRCQAVHKGVANREWVPTPNIVKGSQVWLDAQAIGTTWLFTMFNWKRLGWFEVL